MQTELNYDTVFDAQEHFRLLLDSMSRPGKINTFPEVDILPPAGLHKSTALTGFALLNPDATIYAAGNEGAEIVDYMLINTGTQHAGMAVADYIFLPQMFYADALHEARIGTPTYPEDSATFIVQAALISESHHDGALKLTLKGPGVNGEAHVFVSGISPELLAFVQKQNEEYPLGIDMIITDSHNHIIGIPRSNKFAYADAK